MPVQPHITVSQAFVVLNDLALQQEAIRILAHLLEKSTVMALAEEMENAIIVRKSADGDLERIAVVERRVAEFMFSKDWIAPRQKGRITRYSLTVAGRSALKAISGKMQDARMLTIAKAPDTFPEPGSVWSRSDRKKDAERAAQRVRCSAPPESPLKKLARRRDKDGHPLLEKDLVAVGSRLREDFELAQMERDFINCNDGSPSFSGQNGSINPHKSVDTVSFSARKRVSDALEDLGPELSEVIVRCCCNLEGIEAVEKLFGWPARSGKVVLRIALIHLQRHYKETVGPQGDLIG